MRPAIFHPLEVAAACRLTIPHLSFYLAGSTLKMKPCIMTSTHSILVRCFLHGSLCILVMLVVTWEWKYVGEAGALVGARNSHTLNTLPLVSSSSCALVLVGGASPEHGPLRDNYFAVLPSEIAGERGTS